MFIPDPVSDFFQSRIPHSNCLHPGSRIRIKEFKYFNPKKWILSSRKYDPGCSSWIPDPDTDFLPIPDSGSRGQKVIGSRIPDPDPQHCCRYFTEVKLWSLERLTASAVATALGSIPASSDTVESEGRQMKQC